MWQLFTVQYWYHLHVLLDACFYFGWFDAVLKYTLTALVITLNMGPYVLSKQPEMAQDDFMGSNNRLEKF